MTTCSILQYRQTESITLIRDSSECRNFPKFNVRKHTNVKVTIFSDAKSFVRNLTTKIGLLLSRLHVPGGCPGGYGGLKSQPPGAFRSVKTNVISFHRGVRGVVSYSDAHRKNVVMKWRLRIFWQRTMPVQPPGPPDKSFGSRKREEISPGVAILTPRTTPGPPGM